MADYKDLLWADVPDKIDDMIAKVGDFQNACKKMPKVLREYEAFVELKRTIDDFLETLPLVQQLAHPAMRPRHWTAADAGHRPAALVYSDNVQAVDAARGRPARVWRGRRGHHQLGVKELQIEEKLAVIQEDWADCQLNFAAFKNRGPIQLQMGPTMS